MAKSNKEAMLANLMPKSKKAIPQPIITRTTQVAAPIEAISEPEPAAPSTPTATVTAAKPKAKAAKKVAAKTAAQAPSLEKSRFNLVMDRDVYIAFKQHIVTLPMNGSEYMEHLIRKDLGL